MRREKAGPSYWVCLFCLFPSVIINSQNISPLKIGRWTKPPSFYLFLSKTPSSKTAGESCQDAWQSLPPIEGRFLSLATCKAFWFIFSKSRPLWVSMASMLSILNTFSPKESHPLKGWDDTQIPPSLWIFSNTWKRSKYFSLYDKSQVSSFNPYIRRCPWLVDSSTPLKTQKPSGIFIFFDHPGVQKRRMLRNADSIQILPKGLFY